mmetsp:Transcript_105592/g.340525  ORF Transcript_105592/g.340525 Transcript_105592/m.340525 type:complete len:233 (-) Transcript_105592:24-722(-)
MLSMRSYSSFLCAFRSRASSRTENSSMCRRMKGEMVASALTSRYLMRAKAKNISATSPEPRKALVMSTRWANFDQTSSLRTPRLAQFHIFRASGPALPPDGAVSPRSSPASVATLPSRLLGCSSSSKTMPSRMSVPGDSSWNAASSRLRRIDEGGRKELCCAAAEDAPLMLTFGVRPGCPQQRRMPSPVEAARGRRPRTRRRKVVARCISPLAHATTEGHQATLSVQHGTRA